MSALDFGIGRTVMSLALAMGTLLSPMLMSTSSAAERPAKEGTQDQGPLYSVFKAINGAQWITEGRSERVLYVFFDPNCPYCHYLYDVSKSFVRSGMVEVRWIPVGFLTPTSAGKALAILQAKNPKAAFEANEARYRRQRGGGGAIDEALPTRAGTKQLNKNMALYNATGADGVPMMLWQDRSGRIKSQDGAVDHPTFQYIVSRIRPLK